jgi:hypothetical protein
MAVQKGKLARNKEKAIAGLILKPSISEAAKYAGMGERTLLRWLKDDDFQKSYRDARYHLVQHALTQIQDATQDAARTLRSILNDKVAPASVRVRAASIILDNAIKGVELENLEMRISALEKALNDS